MTRRRSSWLLTDKAHAWLRGQYAYFHIARQAPRPLALLYVFLSVLAHVVFRLESPAWQATLGHPGFARLSARPLRPGDPIRFLVQAAWLACTKAPAPQDAATPRPRKSLRRLRPVQWPAGLPPRLRTTLARLPQAMGRHPRIGQGLAALREPDGRSSRLLLGALLLAMLVLAVVVVTQPFSWTAQLIFVLLLWAGAMMMRHIPGRFPTLMLIVLSLTVSSRYLWWRYTSTLNWNSKLDLVCGVVLLLAETYSWIVLVLGYAQNVWPLRRQPAALPADTSLWPTVDLLIPTYNEDLSIVRTTVYAAMGIDWPQDKLRIYILDDGKRDAFRQFAEEMGVGYITRPDNRHAKAGNLNHALGKTDGELLAIFDCDHIPTRSFLQLTVGWFLKEKKLALVQTPHHFFSPDAFERNLGDFGVRPNENSLFYGLIQDGNDTWDAAFFCGSCAVLRRSAVEAIGGFAVETVTEDAHTSLRLHRAGYSSAYLRIPQAAGLATGTLSAHVGQRIRWARGMAQIFRVDNPLLGKGLSLFQRLCYANAMLHFLSGLPRLVFLLAPLAFLMLHAYIIYAPAIAIMLYVLPHMVHAGLTNSRMQGQYRHTFWGEVYETVLAWYIARPTTVALINPGKGKFNVTAKDGMIDADHFDWSISRPYLFLALLNGCGLAFGIWRLLTGPQHEIGTVIVSMLWVTYNLIIIGAAVAVAAEVRQSRHAHRVQANLPAMIVLPGGHAYPATLHDYSDGGVRVTTPEPDLVSNGAGITLVLRHGQRECAFAGTVLRAQGADVGIRLAPMNVRQHIDFVQCTFARADSWVGWAEAMRRDTPLRSLLEVTIMGGRGYRRLVQYAPPFIRALLTGALDLLSWLLSFLPRPLAPSPSLSSRSSYTS